MQQPESLTLCDQASHLAAAYRHLQEAYNELAQTELCWNEEIDAYLHEEGYDSLEARQFMKVLVADLEPMQKPLQQLALDHQSLCNDLLRVGRGESFSV